MSRENASKSLDQNARTAAILGGWHHPAQASSSNAFRPSQASVQYHIPPLGPPPHQSGSTWTTLQRAHPTQPPLSNLSQRQTPIPFASQLPEAAQWQVDPTLLPRSENGSLASNRGAYGPFPLVLPAVGSAPQNQPPWSSSASQTLARRTPRPPELHSSASNNLSAEGSRAGGSSRGGAHQAGSQSLLPGPPQQRRGPRHPVVSTMEVSGGDASGGARRGNPLQEALSLDTVASISAMPRVAGSKRTREEPNGPEGTNGTSGMTKTCKGQSHQRQDSRKRVRLSQNGPNGDEEEIQWLGTNHGLSLSRPIPAPALVRSVSSSSLASRSTAFAMSPETPAPSSQQSLAPTPASSQSPPFAEDTLNSAATPSSKPPIMRCPSSSLQYVWDAIDNPIVPVLPRNWDAKVFDEAMDRPVVLGNISFEKMFYSYYATTYDPQGLAKGTFERRNQADLEAWFARIRQWESENPEVVAAATRKQNKTIMKRFGS